MSRYEELYTSPWYRRAALALPFLTLVGLAGGYTAAVDWTPAAILIVVGIAGPILLHVAIGIAGYRRAMRDPWPHVEPLTDDDWD
jgi:hypothetical protein